MKTLAFINVKGGVGKTTSSVAFANILASEYDKKVLFIDLDKQANSTRTFGAYSVERPCISDLLTNKDADIYSIIQETKYSNIHIIPANMSLFTADLEIKMDTRTIQQTRLKKHIDKVKSEYDYCIIDCPTDFNMATINGLAFSDEVFVPVKVDAYAFDGLGYVLGIIEDVSDYNPKIHLEGVFVTMYQNVNLVKEGIHILKNRFGKYFYDTYIRQTVKVQESTYDVPLLEYAKDSTAAQDYVALVKEYLEKGVKNYGN